MTSGCAYTWPLSWVAKSWPKLLLVIAPGVSVGSCLSQPVRRLSWEAVWVSADAVVSSMTPSTLATSARTRTTRVRLPRNRFSSRRLRETPMRTGVSASMVGSCCADPGRHICHSSFVADGRKPYTCSTARASCGSSDLAEGVTRQRHLSGTRGTKQTNSCINQWDKLPFAMTERDHTTVIPRLRDLKLPRHDPWGEDARHPEPQRPVVHPTGVVSWLIPGLLMLGLGLLGVTRPSLWADELQTWGMATTPWPEMLAVLRWVDAIIGPY